MHRRRERVLHGVLGDVDAAEYADQHCHGAAVFAAEDPGYLAAGSLRGGTPGSGTAPRHPDVSEGLVLEGTDFDWQSHDLG
ncbi:hypothetical protein D9M72_322730 [compost metagenome]